MTLKEIEDNLARQDLTDRHRKILMDVSLEMKLFGHKDSTEIDRQILVALIQKESIS